MWTNSNPIIKTPEQGSKDHDRAKTTATEDDNFLNIQTAVSENGLLFLTQTVLMDNKRNLEKYWYKKNNNDVSV